MEGNVRQLENAIVASLVFAEGEYLRVRDLQRALEELPPINRRPEESLESFLERSG